MGGSLIQRDYRLIKKKMSSGEHVHEWKYGEPKMTIVMGNSQRQVYMAVRYCKTCLEMEKLELKEKDGKK